MANKKNKSKNSAIRGDQRKVALPTFSNYNLAFKYFVEQGVDAECILPAAHTKKTVHFGELNSPDFVCTPFKHSLGSMIEMLELGADTLVEIGGPCRLGFYGELQEKILRDMGYEFTMINFDFLKDKKKSEWLKVIKSVNPDVKYPQMLIEATNTMKMVKYLDEIEELYHANMGFEANVGAYDKIYRDFLFDMKMAASGNDIKNAYRKAKVAMDDEPLNKPDMPLKVGVVGEYYTIMDKFSNLDVENKLCRMGIEVHRLINVTNYNLGGSEQKLFPAAKNYMKFPMGPTSATTVAAAEKYAKQGFDGLIHVKCFGCTPEVDVMPLLQKLSQDYHIPVLYLSYDTQTSDTGLDTRLEAFYDMISLKKKVLKN
ncbi:MAG: hypothetical protein LUF29_04700 [Oscillospiraceae bacterium]|nr:hypothetical protein [Oscillospiraceae bacterium]